MPTAQFFDASFSPQDSSEGILLIHLGKRQLAYSVYDSVTGTFQGLSYYSASPSDPDWRFQQESLGMMSKEAVFKANYHKVAIAVSPDTCTLVAEPLFNKKEAPQYLGFNISNPGNAAIAADLIQEAKAYSVYSLPNSLTPLLQKLFTEPSIVNADVPLINNLLLENKRKSTNQLFVSIEEGGILVLALEKGKLLLFNKYAVKKETDVLYFCLSICEQLGFNPSQVDLQLLGTLDREDATHQLLKEHFSKVQLAQRPKAYKYAEVLDQVPAQRFYALFSLLTCVS